MKVGKHVKKQLSYLEKIDENKHLHVEEKNKIQNDDSEENIIYKLRKIYNSSKFSKKELNTHLILLENKKLSISSVSHSGLITTAMSIGISMIAIVLTINNNVRDLSKDVSKLVGNTSEDINSIKEYLDLFKKLLDRIPWMFGVFYGIIVCLLVYEGVNLIIEKRKNIAVNIHKSVIQEHLNKIEEKLKEIEKNDETKKTLNEILKTGEGTLRETQALGRVFDTKKYT